MMEQVNKTFGHRIVGQPALQAVFILLFGVFLTLLDKGSEATGIGKTGTNSAWVLMTACILFYALCSSVFSLKAQNPNRYWRDAIFSFIGLMILCGLVAYFISGQSIDEAGSFRWIFMVLSIGYLVFLVIVRLMRRIVEIAIRQDEKLRGQ